MKTSLIVFMVAASAFAQSSYVDRAALPIKALTEEQMKAYREGTGMGLAIPAEMNGFPGPRHVLDLAAPLALTAEQRTRMQAVYDAMHTKAVALGAEIIDLERSLDAGFANGTMSAERLGELTRAIGERNGELRRVHLAAHLAAREILTPEQVAAYAKLRGYGASPHQHAH